MSERERRLVIIGGAVAAVLLIFGVVLPLDSSVSKAQARIGQKQADLVWMQAVGPSSPPRTVATKPSSQKSLLVVVDRAARRGRAWAIRSPERAGGPGRLRVRPKKRSRHSRGWLARLSSRRIGVETASVDNARRARQVNAGLCFSLMKRTLRFSILAISPSQSSCSCRPAGSWIRGSCRRHRLYGYSRNRLGWAAAQGSSQRRGVGNSPGAASGRILHGKFAAVVDLTRGEEFLRGEIEAGRGGSYCGARPAGADALDPPLVPELSSATQAT